MQRLPLKHRIELFKSLRDSDYKGSYLDVINETEKSYFACGGNKDNNEMPFGMPLKSANPYVMSRYDQPLANKTILPDVNRPYLMNTNASEYKIGVGFNNGEVTIPTIVNGQYLDNKNAIENYRITGEKFKQMDNPYSYSNYYDDVNELGLMQNKAFGGYNWDGGGKDNPQSWYSEPTQTNATTTQQGYVPYKLSQEERWQNTVPYRMQQQEQEKKATNEIYTDPQGSKHIQNIPLETSIDPIDLVGTGIYKGIANLAGNGVKTLINKGVPIAKKAITNTYKINPLATKLNNPNKKIDIPKNNFKSEINWSKWNKEISEDKNLLNEYHNIEKSSKINNTWMKNPDGSEFNGTPEQFVQLNSKRGKELYGNGYETMYRGDKFHIPTLREKGHQYAKDAIFGTKNENVAIGYGGYKKFNYNTQNADDFIRNHKYYKAHKPEWQKDYLNNPNRYSQQFGNENAGYHELIYPKSNNNISFDAQGQNWGYIQNDDVFNSLDKKTIDNMTNVRIKNKAFDTDDIAIDVKNRNLDYAHINNVNDGGLLGDDVIINSRKGFYPKSLWGNNGKFDMTNPNIYKSIIPAGIGYSIYNNTK